MQDQILQVDENMLETRLDRLVSEKVEQLLNAEADEITGAARYERTGDRKAYRVGHYERDLTVKAGTVTLKVPKLKGALFESAVIERYRRREQSVEDPCLCSISCCGFSHDDFSGLGRACRPRNGLNWMVLVSPPERTGKDYDQHAPSTVYPSFAAERGIRRVDRAENTCRRSRRCVSTSRRRICRPCRR